ncbi:MAG: hypothetical protein WEB52_00495 [Dehalococcoidia bacterium]
MVAYIIREALASYWTQLVAVETVAAEYFEEFNGEDPMKPSFRGDLDDPKQRIVETKEELLRFIGNWDLPIDHERSLGITRALAQRVLG